jgi:hypothetical protein
MFWTISVILVLIWAWGFITGATGAMIHLLLIAAGATALMGILLSGRRNAF